MNLPDQRKINVAKISQPKRANPLKTRKLKKGDLLNTPIEVALNPFTIMNCPGIADLPEAASPEEQLEATSAAIARANYEANRKEAERATAAAIGKLELLFPFYGLARTGNDADFKLLALRMAMDKFPAFGIIDVGGVPYKHSRSNFVTLTQLLADVEAVKQSKLPDTWTDKDAIEVLTKEHPTWNSYTVDTLQNWHSEANNEKFNPFIRIWRIAEDAGKLLPLIEIFGSKPAASRKSEK